MLQYLAIFLLAFVAVLQVRRVSFELWWQMLYLSGRMRRLSGAEARAAMDELAGDGALFVVAHYAQRATHHAVGLTAWGCPTSQTVQVLQAEKITAPRVPAGNARGKPAPLSKTPRVLANVKTHTLERPASEGALSAVLIALTGLSRKRHASLAAEIHRTSVPEARRIVARTRALQEATVVRAQDVLAGRGKAREPDIDYSITHGNCLCFLRTVAGEHVGPATLTGGWGNFDRKAAPGDGRVTLPFAPFAKMGALTVRVDGEKVAFYRRVKR